MFIHAVPDNLGKKDGYYCSLVESHRENGKSVHSIKIFFGFIPTARLPYLKTAFNDSLFHHEVISNGKGDLPPSECEGAIPYERMRGGDSMETWRRYSKGNPVG